ncbi:MAG TPA: ABC transporter permease [Negativicutes bacterium]|nr:ABC transporter permease [Negativicutes bacterium]
MHIQYGKKLKSGPGHWGLLLLGFWAAIALAGFFVTPYAPDAYTGKAFLAPSSAHWLGTNDVGQDIFSQLMAGARTSLGVAVGASIASAFLGALLGAGGALVGGWVERLTMRMMDIGLVIPPILAAMLAAAYLQPSPVTLVGILAFFFWPGTGRILRAQTLLLRESGPVTAARTFGAGRGYLLRRHILPDLAPVLSAAMIHDARRAVFLEAGLAFLGISDPTVQSWGRMIQQALAFTYLDVWQWWLLPPGIAVTTLVLAFALIGTGLEETHASD